jgi:hypothetical protein
VKLKVLGRPILLIHPYCSPILRLVYLLEMSRLAYLINSIRRAAVAQNRSIVAHQFFASSSDENVLLGIIFGVIHIKPWIEVDGIKRRQSMRS